jgi:hypothetical protein
MRWVFILAATLFVGACVGAGAGVGSAVSGNNRLTNICDIIANPADYAGERINIRGIVRTDYFEFSGIADAACHNRRIAFGPERDVEDGLDEFLRALESVRGDQAHVVEVSANGVLLWRPNEVPVLVLNVRAFSDATIVDRPETMAPIDPR